MKRQAVAVASVLVLATQASAADKKYGSGTSDAQNKLGQTMPLSGPASAYRVVAKTQAAYFKMINEQGGVNGCKINLIVLDDWPNGLDGTALPTGGDIAGHAGLKCGG
jgi:ABC-type branched-subunit amino acid transport system substrate-binding protein